MTVGAPAESVTSRSESKRNRKPQVLLLGEAIIWQPTQGDWQQLYGNFQELGVSVEWHDFELNANTTFDWARSFHPNSLELCLNLAGHASLRSASSTVDFEPLTAGFTRRGRMNCAPGERPESDTVSSPSNFPTVFCASIYSNATVRFMVWWKSSCSPARLPPGWVESTG